MATSGSLKRSRTTTGDLGNVVQIEEHEIVQFQKDDVLSVAPVVSGKELMENFGEATKIEKQMLPFNTLIQVMSLRAVDISGPIPAIYMTGKILLQQVERAEPSAKRTKNAAEEEEGEVEEEEQDSRQNYSVISSDFMDFEGNDINDIIQCTAPRALARSWQSGATTSDHLEKGVILLINESFQRDHPANQFMGNVHLNYQYYYPSDLDKNVYDILQEGVDFTSPLFQRFFASCLEQSAQYKARNKKHCAAVERYGAVKMSMSVKWLDGCSVDL